MIDAFEDELHALLSEDERLEKKQQETQDVYKRQMQALAMAFSALLT